LDGAIDPFDDNQTNVSGVKSGGNVGDSVGDNVGDTDSEKVILELMRKNPTISATKISKELGLTSRSIERYISSMKNADLIDRIGPPRGGHWVVK